MESLRGLWQIAYISETLPDRNWQNSSVMFHTIYKYSTNSLAIVIVQLSLVCNYTGRIEVVVGKWLNCIVKLLFIEKEMQFSTEHQT